jgi:hypothetical protein
LWSPVVARAAGLLQKGKVMLLTEEEAKQKWCPMVRLVAVSGKNEVINHTSYNRAMHVTDIQMINPCGSFCIVSDCMMWRREDQETWIDRIEESRKKSCPAMSAQEAADLLPRQGYCGLGGKP